MNDEKLYALIDEAAEYDRRDNEYERFFIKAGQKEVVEWIRECKTTPIDTDDYGYYVWKSHLLTKQKEWNIE